MEDNRELLIFEVFCESLWTTRRFRVMFNKWVVFCCSSSIHIPGKLWTFWRFINERTHASSTSDWRFFCNAFDFFLNRLFVLLICLNDLGVVLLVRVNKFCQHLSWIQVMEILTKISNMSKASCSTNNMNDPWSSTSTSPWPIIWHFQE